MTQNNSARYTGYNPISAPLWDNMSGQNESMPFSLSENYINEIRLLDSGYKLLAKARELGNELETYGITEDKLKEVERALSLFLEDNDEQPGNEVAESKNARLQVSELKKELTSIFNNRRYSKTQLFQPPHRKFYGQFAKPGIV